VELNKRTSLTSPNLPSRPAAPLDHSFCYYFAPLCCACCAPLRFNYPDATDFSYSYESRSVCTALPSELWTKIFSVPLFLLVLAYILHIIERNQPSRDSYKLSDLRCSGHMSSHIMARWKMRNEICIQFLNVI
jgi:hypothetical protein